MSLVKNYMGKRWGHMTPCVILFAAFNLYFVFLIQDGKMEYLLYLDFLLLIPAAVVVIVDWRRFRERQRRLERLLEGEEIICRLDSHWENVRIAEHDVEILEAQLEKCFQENCELEDYVAKWCHELKIPLAAALLMGERIQDSSLKNAMRGQMERMNQLLSSLLLGCRLQGALFDLQVRKTSLKECVRTSIHNNQFFLIQKHFSLKEEVGEETVYTDPSWLVYVLDQLISNAVKYTKESPSLHLWSERRESWVRLFVEDKGVGIRDDDLPRIFEKGYTGRNYHNGKYKSTGMGLYMAAKIMGKMGHELQVESQYGEYTRFCLVFKENSYFCVAKADVR